MKQHEPFREPNPTRYAKPSSKRAMDHDKLKPLYEHVAKYVSTPLVPRHVTLAICLGLLACWFVSTHAQVKVCAFLGATVFAGIEFVFRGISGIIEFNLERSVSYFLVVAYTTWEQWAMNLLLCGPVLHWAAMLLETWLVVVLFPLLVFAMEIIAGYFLCHIWGRRGWFYEGKWAFFDGNITLTFLPVWWVMGLIHSLLSYFIYIPMSVVVLDTLDVAHMPGFRF